MHSDLTQNQQRVLDYIAGYVAEHSQAPSLREIAEALSLRSHSSAQDYVEALVRKGALERLPQHRGLRLAGAGQARQRANARPALRELPLVGRVAAGTPILADSNIETSYAIDAALFRPRADFLLRVVGLSMRDAGILDGDLIAVHRTPDADDGRIVVARLDDEITVKRLQRRHDRLLLLSENPDFAPIEVDPRRTNAFAIEGLYVGVIRQG
ncbi:SOS-response transcriptional repressor LexA [Tahibacter aquaticus]|uniref:LexA repressor n=1 Tax=Tahibacter aquaticus TaxID=520092 RepID=A0A4R6YNP2_9GAMM|nr:transcriptional repressor LexA [Tahibacter aquaticus]TDR39195.1 SOS-response transcriptional repressor LexA [Tahibacter aquaticus]